MKKIFIVILLFISSLSNAQIKTAEYNFIKKEHSPYDSLRNFLTRSEIDLYVGQTLYLPKTTCDKKNGFYDFKRDVKGHTYKPVTKTSRFTKYDAIAGKYFKVVGVEQWVYKDKYIYIENGIVTAIQKSM